MLCRGRGRLLLLPDGQPHRTAAGGEDRSAGGCGGGRGHRLRHGRHLLRSVEHRRRREAHPGGQDAVRLHLCPAEPRHDPLRRGGDVHRHVGPEGRGGESAGKYLRGLSGDAGQSHAEDRGHPGRGQDRPRIRSQHQGRGGQYLCHALSPETPGAGSGHGGPLRHQVPKRPRRRPGGLCLRQAGPDGSGADVRRKGHDRLRPGGAGGVPGPAGPEDL